MSQPFCSFNHFKQSRNIRGLPQRAGADRPQPFFAFKLKCDPSTLCFTRFAHNHFPALSVPPNLRFTRSHPIQFGIRYLSMLRTRNTFRPQAAQAATLRHSRSPTGTAASTMLSPRVADIARVNAHRSHDAGRPATALQAISVISSGQSD